MKIGNRIYRKWSRVGLTLVLVLLAACVKVDTPPALEITVVDSFNNLVSDALVAVFDTQEEWAMLENPQQAWKMTNKDGKVLFVNLHEKNYFVFVEKNDLNNLKNEIGTVNPVLKNQIRSLRIQID